VAARLGLPGSGAGGAAASRTGAGGEEKTPHPAPSAELLRRAVDLIPNDQGHFDAREDWTRIGHAIKGAAIAGGCEAQGREAFLDFCDRWGGGDAIANAKFWDTCNAPHVGWGTLMRELERTNPAGREALRADEAAAAFAQSAAQNIAALSANILQPVQPLNPSHIPPRQWLYARHYIRGVDRSAQSRTRYSLTPPLRQKRGRTHPRETAPEESSLKCLKLPHPPRRGKLHLCPMPACL